MLVFKGIFGGSLSPPKSTKSIFCVFLRADLLNFGVFGRLQSQGRKLRFFHGIPCDSGFVGGDRWRLAVCGLRFPERQPPFVNVYPFFFIWSGYFDSSPCA